MKQLHWDDAKNLKLKLERAVSFEDVQTAIEENNILEDKLHPNQKRYPNQKMMVVEINNYAYLVPYVENGDRLFLKTIIPSRKATRDHVKQLKKGDKK